MRNTPSPDVEIVASYVLMVGLWRMSATHTSAYGIRIAGAAMVMAVLAGCLYLVGAETATSAHWWVNSALAATALVLGGGTAWWRARNAAMTALPQLTLLFNGMIAVAAAAIASLELFAHRAHATADLVMTLMAAWLAVLSCTGSFIAWARLSEIIRFPVHLPARSALSATLLLAAVVLGVNIASMMSGDAAPLLRLYELTGAFFGCALVCALLVTLPISAGCMPVAVSMISAVTGMTVALVRILLGMPALTIVGMLVVGARIAARTAPGRVGQSDGHGGASLGDVGDVFARIAVARRG